MAKTDTITIKVTGNKKFRQKIMDVIYEALMDDDIQVEGTKPGNGFDLDSTIAPSDEVA
jgi:hypothetical protein